MNYYESIKKNELIYSVDMIRLSLKTSCELGQEFLDRISCRETDIGIIEYYQSFKAFQYRHLFTIKGIGESSITIGLMPNDDKRKECVKGYIEFNPNKVCGDLKYNIVMRIVNNYFQEIKVKRWDLAIDIPLPRKQVRIIKDQRIYSYIISPKGETEYLGRRSNDGFIKLYDKTIESNLEVPLTRFEMTIDGLKPFNELNIPNVYMLSEQLKLNALIELSGTDLVLVELLQNDEYLERHLKMLGRKKLEKIKPYLLPEDTTLKLDSAVYNILINRLKLYNKTQIM